MNPPRRPNLKAQVLTDLDSDREVIIESKYIPLIWGNEEVLADWCESWNLTHKITTGTVKRTIHEMKFPIFWLEITRANKRAEIDTTEESQELEESNLEKSDIDDETDASL